MTTYELNSTNKIRVQLQWQLMNWTPMTTYELNSNNNLRVELQWPLTTWTPMTTSISDESRKPTWVLSFNNLWVELQWPLMSWQVMTSTPMTTYELNSNDNLWLQLQWQLMNWTPMTTYDLNSNDNFYLGRKPKAHMAQLSKGGTKVVFRKWIFDIYQVQSDLE